MNFNLSFDDGDDNFKSEKEIIEERKEKHLKELNKYNKELLKKLKNDKECPVFTEKESIGKGGFGETAKKNNQIHKIILDLTSKYLGEAEQQWEWMFNRYKNFCNDMLKYSSKTSKLFPENFIKYNKDDCGYCITKNKPAIYFKMDLIQNMLSGDFKKYIKKSSLKQEELDLIFAQIYYVAIKTNQEKLYHNDLKPANIVLKKADKDFIYSNLKQNNKKLILKIKKGDYIPVFIDYDLISFNHMQNDLGLWDFPASGSSSDDFSYFTQKTIEYNNKLKNNKILLLESESDDFNLEETYNVFNELLNDRVQINQTGGKKNKNKKIRNHKGINQKTGKLKKGYKYTNKKLKSGLLQIVKI